MFASKFNEYLFIVDNITYLFKYNLRHLIKLYDSIEQLKFSNDKLAIGMFSKDGEYVEFHGMCECSGQVKNNNKSINIC